MNFFPFHAIMITLIVILVVFVQVHICIIFKVFVIGIRGRLPYPLPLGSKVHTLSLSLSPPLHHVYFIFN